MNEKRKEKMQRNEAMGKKIWDVLTPFGIMIICLVVVTIIGIMLASSIWVKCTGESVPDIGALMDQIPYLSQVISIAFYVLAFLMLRKGFAFDQMRYGKTENRWNVFQIILGILVMMCIGHLWSTAISKMGLHEIFPEYAQSGPVSFSSQNPVLLILGTVIIGPIVEEIAFRGMVYRRGKSYYGKAWGIFLSSALFGVYHLNMIQFIYTLAIGVAACLLYEASETLLVPILAHMMLNLWALTNEYLAATLDKAMGHGLALISAVEAGLVVILLLVLRKKQKSSK